MAIRTTTFDPKQDIFYTASLDQKLCRWNTNLLLWKIDIEVSEHLRLDHCLQLTMIICRFKAFPRQSIQMAKYWLLGR